MGLSSIVLHNESLDLCHFLLQNRSSARKLLCFTLWVGFAGMLNVLHV